MLKDKKNTLAPNILLTNFCNQNCSYCFAQEKMRKSQIKEISLADFKKLIKILKANKIDTLRLMGGEPTLHSKFEKIIKLALNEFNQVLIFTNGLIPVKMQKILEKNLNKINFNFNIDTPAFENNQEKRKEIISLIEKLAQNGKTNIGFTLADLSKDYTNLLIDFGPQVLRKIGVRFGIAKSLSGDKPFFLPQKYSQLGKKIVDLVQFFKKSGVKEIFLDCGLKKEMFDWRERHYLTKNSHLRGWGCEGKWGSFDVTPNLYAFPCFPYSSRSYRQKIKSKENIVNLNKKLKKSLKKCLK